MSCWAWTRSTTPSARDHVCVTVPLTRETHHLMDARRIARLRAGAYLYNISRGAVIDEPALVDALRAGKLAGAGLTCSRRNRCPQTSPLWEMENVILTPHVAGLTPLYYHRTAALFAENLDRFLRAAARQQVRPRPRLLKRRHLRGTGAPSR